MLESLIAYPKAEPLCPVFGACGGCLYQDVTYEAELEIKHQKLRDLLGSQAGIDPFLVQPVTASPESYHTRSRLDLTLRKYRNGDLLVGFMPEQGKRVVEIDACAIARREISQFIPELKELAARKLPPDYQTANLVVKTGDDGRVAWGGIGRRSLVMNPEDYLWTELRGRKIFYSLETFFQANHGILPQLLDCIETLTPLSRRKVFWDLYSGVGLFGIGLTDLFSRIIMIEEHSGSVAIARHNTSFHGLPHVEVHEGRVEDRLGEVLSGALPGESTAMIDPPRKGLSPSALEMLVKTPVIDFLFYLSCKPESLVRDLGVLIPAGWQVRTVVPFDFFPRTRHLETLVLLERRG